MNPNLKKQYLKKQQFIPILEKSQRSSEIGGDDEKKRNKLFYGGGGQNARVKTRYKKKLKGDNKIIFIR